MALPIPIAMQMQLKVEWQKQGLVTKSRDPHHRSRRSICFCIRNANGSDASKKAAGSSGGGGGSAGNSNYVVPLDKTFSIGSSSCITRPLAEILRDLNKRIPDNIIVKSNPSFIPWYHANRMMSFYAPGWCGEIRDVIYSENTTVTVVYRLTIRGSDGEAYRESSGTISSSDGDIADPVAAAEEIAFCRACARFGLGLHLYHQE